MSPSSTKRGPSRKHQQGDGRGLKGASSRYVQGLLNHWAKKRREAFAKVGKPRHAHGAVTFVGEAYELEGVKPTSREYVLAGGQYTDGTSFHTVRRIWLAGVSAQRGY